MSWRWQAAREQLARRSEVVMVRPKSALDGGPRKFFSSVSNFTVVSRRHFFFVAPDWRHVTGTMMAALGGLRGFVGERR